LRVEEKNPGLRCCSSGFEDGRKGGVVQERFLGLLVVLEKRNHGFGE